MKLEIRTLDNGLRLAKLEGKMDIQGMNQVGEEFGVKIGNSGESTVVDMSDVSFMASLGMRALITTARGVSSHGGKMVLLNPQPLVKEALVTAGINMLVPIYNDFDEACCVLQAARGSN